MTKQQFMEKHNITLREVENKDYEEMEERGQHITDYMYRSNYIIGYKGENWFSINGSLADMKDMVKWIDEEETNCSAKKDETLKSVDVEFNGNKLHLDIPEGIELTDELYDQFTNVVKNLGWTILKYHVRDFNDLHDNFAVEDIGNGDFRAVRIRD